MATVNEESKVEDGDSKTLTAEGTKEQLHDQPWTIGGVKGMFDQVKGKVVQKTKDSAESAIKIVSAEAKETVGHIKESLAPELDKGKEKLGKYKEKAVKQATETAVKAALHMK